MIYFVQLLMVLGGSWCGAVLSQVFLHSEYTRAATLVALLPALGAWLLEVQGSTPERRRLQRWLVLVWLVVLLGCAALAMTDLVVLSDGGRWKRALAVASFGATLYELWRLWRTPRVVESNDEAFFTTLPFATLGEALTAQAKKKGVAREVLVSQLEQAIAKAAPTHFQSERTFEAKYEPKRQTIELSVVVPVEGGDHHVYLLPWQLEAQEQARANDAQYATVVGFECEGAGFEAVVDRVTREVLGLPKQGPLDELRDDWLRLMNARRFLGRALKQHLELVASPQSLPRPIGGHFIVDLAFEGPKFFDSQTSARAIERELVVADRALRVGTVSWTACPVSVLGAPDLPALEAWVTKWQQPARDGDGSKLTGSVHRVDLIRFTTGVELTVDFGSAPVSALEELVVLLRKSGEVSFDHAALEALQNRRHEGTRDDIVPLVRREGGTLSEHLVGELWLTYAVESRQSFAGMSPHEAQELGLGPGSLRALSIENLRKRLPPVRISGHSGVYLLTLPGEGGFFEASLLLLDEVWTEQLAPLIKGDPVVCIPFRDLVFVTGSEDAAGLARLQELVADTQGKDLEYPLSTQVLVRREGQWRVR